MQPEKSNRSQITAPNSALPMPGFASAAVGCVGGASALTSILTRRQQLGVDVLDALDAAAVRRWSSAAAASLDAHRAEIDRLNVVPGPRQRHRHQPGHHAAGRGRRADRAPHRRRGRGAAGAGPRRGARGERELRQHRRPAAARRSPTPPSRRRRCDAAALREGLRRGAVQARAAVADPVEGTILTVAAAAAAAVPDGPASLAEVAGLALAAADEALRRTPEQLAVLARAGVVDAGRPGPGPAARGAGAHRSAATRRRTSPSRRSPTPSTRTTTPAPATGVRGAVPARHRAPAFTDEAADALRGRAGPARRLGGRRRHRRRHLERARAHRRRRRGGRGRHRRRPAVPDHGLPVRRAGAAEGRRGHRDRPRRRPSAGCSRARACASSPTTSRAVRDVVEAVLDRRRARGRAAAQQRRSITGVADAAAAEVRERGVRVAVVPTRSPVQGAGRRRRPRRVAPLRRRRRRDGRGGRGDPVRRGHRRRARVAHLGRHLPGRRRPRADRRRGRRDRPRHARRRAGGQRPAARHRRRADDRAGRRRTPSPALGDRAAPPRPRSIAADRGDCLRRRPAGHVR